MKRRRGASRNFLEDASGHPALPRRRKMLPSAAVREPLLLARSVDLARCVARLCRCARAYLDTSPMSKTALIQQLSSSAGDKFRLDSLLVPVDLEVPRREGRVSPRVTL